MMSQDFKTNLKLISNFDLKKINSLFSNLYSLTIIDLNLKKVTNL